MQKRYHSFIIVCLLIIGLVFLWGCKRATSTAIPILSATVSPKTNLEGSITPGASEVYPQPTEQINPFPTIPILPTTTEQAYPQPSIETGYPYPEPSQESGYPYPPGVPTPTINLGGLVTATTIPTPEQEATVTQPQLSSTPTKTATEVPAYPGPGGLTETEPYPGPQSTATGPYPGPEITDTQAPYVGPVTNTPRPTRTSARSTTPTGIPSGTISPVPTAGTETPGPKPSELPPKPPLSPPPAGSSVTIWHSWGSTETDMLQTIIESFQRLNPDVTFNLRYIPLDELFDSFYEAAYLGQGPGLLLGPAAWGPDLFEGDLVSDLNPYVPMEFLSYINPAALSSGQYQGSLISLPLSQRGMVMFRNTSIIPSAPQSFEELIELSHQATRNGIVGSYLERGAYFSAANIQGLGGELLNEDGYPAFNTSFGVNWFDLLADYDIAGAFTFNTNRDLDMFKRKRVGIIIDGTWNISLLRQIIGDENLAIDPWPSYNTGHMSGWVESDSVFLNANLTDDDRFAALSFIGYLLDTNVQVRLAEVGHIPSVVTAKPRDRLLQEAMVAFSRGVPYPIDVSADTLNFYWKNLDIAIQSVFTQGTNPSQALQIASDTITQSINDIANKP